MRNAVRDFLVVTCEHGGNRIPAEYAGLFRGWGGILATHRGFDPGALVMARQLAAEFHAPLVASTVSRLLIDLNRSLGNPRVWSDATRVLPPAGKLRIVRRHYAPYRQRVEAIVTQAVAAGRRVIHLSSHSFTPVLDAQVRNADVGLLYDPARPAETAMAACWKSTFARHAPELRVRRNYPYRGRNDGLTSSLRRRFPCESYVGMEIELNQGLMRHKPQWRRLRGVVVATLIAALR
jgi:predicted N-formylglutamate amidohydrolase